MVILAHALQAQAERQLKSLVTVSHDAALRVAAQFRVSAYDARFLTAAERLGGRLVTEDARLRAAAPARTIGLVDLVST